MSEVFHKFFFYYSCTIVIGFFQSTYIGIEQSSSHQIPVGIVSGMPPHGFAILQVYTITVTASKHYFLLDVYWMYLGIAKVYNFS